MRWYTILGIFALAGLGIFIAWYWQQQHTLLDELNTPPEGLITPIPLSPAPQVLEGTFASLNGTMLSVNVSAVTMVGKDRFVTTTTQTLRLIPTTVITQLISQGPGKAPIAQIISSDQLKTGDHLSMYYNADTISAIYVTR